MVPLRDGRVVDISNPMTRTYFVHNMPGEKHIVQVSKTRAPMHTTGFVGGTKLDNEIISDSWLLEKWLEKNSDTMPTVNQIKKGLQDWANQDLLSS